MKLRHFMPKIKMSVVVVVVDWKIYIEAIIMFIFLLCAKLKRSVFLILKLR